MTLYSDLATHGQDLIEKVTSLTGSYIGSVDNFPYGPLSSLADLATAVESISGFILDVTTAAAKSAFENTKAANDIAQAVAAQDAIPNNTWPPGVVEYPGSSNSDRERIQITIGDATTQDGDESDWSLS